MELKVLLVCGDGETIKLFENALEEYDPGYKLIHTDNCDDAIEIISVETKPFKLVVLETWTHGDMFTPLDVIQQAKEVAVISGEETKVLAISDRISEYDELIMEGADAFLTKPVTEKSIRRALNDFID